MQNEQLELFQNGALIGLSIIILIAIVVFSKKRIIVNYFLNFVQEKYARLGYYILLLIVARGLISSIASILSTEGYRNNIYRSKLLDFFQGLFVPGIAVFLNSVITLTTMITLIILAVLFYKFIKLNNLNEDEKN